MAMGLALDKNNDETHGSWQADRQIGVFWEAIRIDIKGGMGSDIDGGIAGDGWTE